MSSRRRPALADAASAFGIAAGIAGVALLALGLTGCSDEGEPRPALSEQSEFSEGESGHLARVHLILQPQPGTLEPEPQLQISGRFVEYRGISEDFARARTNLPVPVWEQLVPGQCVPSQSLLPPTDLPRHSAAESEAKELSMVDAGDLRIRLGERELVASLALVPDILPWLDGVEYVEVDDRLPELALGPDGTAPISVSIDGSPEGGLDAFSTIVAVPEALELEAARLTRSRLTLSWRPPGDSGDTVVLSLQAFGSVDGEFSEPRGEALTCLVADTGRAALALTPLREAGLDISAAKLRVSASRFGTAKVSAGDFGEVEVFVELRTIEILEPQPPPSRAGFGLR